jgi:hypothetical protein
MAMPDDRPPAPVSETPAVLAAVTAALADWRTAHPQATFAEIEAAVEAQLAPLRAQLIAAALPPDPAPATADEAARPTCPRCAVGLRDRGRHDRTVVVPGEASLTLRRTYWACPRCGEGLFPPR